MVKTDNNNANSRSFRFDSPPKDPLQNTPFSNFKSKILNEV